MTPLPKIAWTTVFVFVVPALLLFIVLDWINFAALIGTIAALAAAIYWNARQSDETASSSVPVKAPKQPKPSSLRQEAILSAFRNFPNPIIWLDPNGTIALANEAAIQHFGESLSNRHITSILRAPAVIDAINKVLDGADAERVTYTEPVPVERHFEALVSPIKVSPKFNATGEAPSASALLVLQDFTAIKRTDQMRADFVANSSHELRTPLASLNGFIETLRGPARDDPEARDKFLSIMEEQAARMGRLIDDLLSLGRIELNEHVSPKDPVNLLKITEEVVSATKPQAEKKRMDVSISLSETLGKQAGEGQISMVPGDRDELYQVLQNLVDNAIKYGKPKGHVAVRIATARDKASGEAQIQISVTDDGEGIPREHIPRLTERFYRVDVQRSRDTGGTGLGLAIVKHIVNRHRGKLSIESEVGQGSTFTVVLPTFSSDSAETKAGADVIKM